MATVGAPRLADSDCASRIAAALRVHGFTVHLAEDVDAAVHAAHAGIADVIVCRDQAHLVIAAPDRRSGTTRFGRPRQSRASESHTARICDEALAVLAASFRQSDLTLAGVASRVGVSREHLCRSIIAVTGRGFRAHLQSIRVRAAREMLVDTNASIKETAFVVGYKSASLLIRHFSTHYGRTPREYRTGRRRGLDQLPVWSATSIGSARASRGDEH